CIELRGTERWLEASALRILGSVQHAMGRTEAGLATLRDALRLSTTTGDLHGLTLAQVCLAEAHYLQGGYDQAREYLELAQGRVKEEKSRSLLISGLIQRLAGQIEAASGRYVAAKQHIAQSISIFTTTQIPYEMALSNYAMGLLSSATGDVSGAETYLLVAKTTLDRLGVKPECFNIDKVLEDLDRGTRTDFKSRLRQHSDSTGSVHVESDPAGASTAGMRMAPAERDGNTVSSDSAVTGTNDLLLMQRLIEASASRDLLLQELVAIIYDNFPVEFVAVLKIEEGSKPEPLASKGLSLLEAGTAFQSVEISSQRTGVSSDGAFLVHFMSGFGTGSGHSKTSPTWLYARFRSGPDPIAYEARLRA